jgi:hypothetical protein
MAKSKQSQKGQKQQKAMLSVIGGLLITAALYYMVDALTTKSPTRRRRDIRDLRLIEEGATVVRTVW